MREDIIGEGRAPREVEEYLIRLAGTNPYGEAKYRVVLAQNRVVKQAAAWHDWDQTLSIQERGGFVTNDRGEMVPSIRQPDRVVKEMRTIARYPICNCADGVLVDEEFLLTGKQQQPSVVRFRNKRAEAGDCEECNGVRGWIIEKWIPAHKLGSEQAWYAAKVDGTDLPKLGPYPNEGVYKRVPNSRATLHVPSMRQLGDLISWLESREFSVSNQTDAQYYRELAIAREYENQRALEQEQLRVRELIRQQLDPIMGNTLEAGRERERIAQRMRERGIRIGHVGA